MAEITIADASPRVLYTVGSTPTTGPWSIPWPYYAASDILVYFDDVLQTITTHYTIAGTAVDDGFSGGSITAVSNQNDIVVTVKRDIPVARTTDFPPSGVFNIATLNKDLDRLYAVSQQLEEVLARALSLSVTSAAAISGTLPEPEANKVFGWDAAATSIVNITLVGNFKGAWTTSTVYILNDIITINGNSYICVTAHTSGTFSTDLAAVKWSILSQKGTTGNSAGLEFIWESLTTDTDQGSGKLWFNNATLASVTTVYVDDEDVNAVNLNSFVDSWDDSTNTIKGVLQIVENANVANFAVYNITGSVTSASTYSKIAVTHVASGGSFSDGNNVACSFTRSGDDGILNSVVGDTSPQLGGDLDANGSNILMDTGTGINDENDLQQIIFTTTSSAVNEITVTNAATGNGPSIAATGGDTNVDLTLSSKGTGNVNLTQALMKDTAETVIAKGNFGATPAFDVSTGNVQWGTVNQNITSSTMTNWPATGKSGHLELEIINGSAFSIVWPTSVDWVGGSAPSLTASGTDKLIFKSRDAGTTVLGFVAGLDVK